MTTVRVECAKCGGTRNCNVTASFKEVGGNEFYSSEVMWNIIQCCGCDYTFVQSVETNSEDFIFYKDTDGSEVSAPRETIKYWPALSRRQRPEWMEAYGIRGDTGIGDVTALDRALVEVYGALDGDLKLLSGIGIRTVFDIGAELLGINEKLSFTKKLDALVSAGHIGAIDRDRLEILVEAGNASAHRGWTPKHTDLDIMMGILEHFISHAFISPARAKQLDKKAKQVKDRVPPRKNK